MHVAHACCEARPRNCWNVQSWWCGRRISLGRFMRKKVFPLLRAFAHKQSSGRPDKVIIVIDRERRSDCCPDLSYIANSVLSSSLAAENIEISFSVIIPDPCFECWLFANVEALDSSPLFKTKPSTVIGVTTDGRDMIDVIRPCLKPGIKWDKVRFGKGLAQRIDLRDNVVLSASRSLRKLVKEL